MERQTGTRCVVKSPFLDDFLRLAEFLHYPQPEGGILGNHFAFLVYQHLALPEEVLKIADL